MKDRILHHGIAFPHSLPIQIRFSDYDSFRHINNNAYMAYFDIGKLEFYNLLMGRPCTPDEISAAIVNINVDFIAPARMGEKLEVRTAVTHIGERSFTLYQRIVNPVTDDIKAQSTAIIAGFDVNTQSGTPLPDELLAALHRITT